MCISTKRVVAAPERRRWRVFLLFSLFARSLDHRQRVLKRAEFSKRRRNKTSQKIHDLIRRVQAEINHVEWADNSWISFLLWSPLGLRRRNSENSEWVLNGYNYIIKGSNLGGSPGAAGCSGTTQISLISVTMMAALKAFHLLIKELASDGEPVPLSIFNQAVIRKIDLIFSVSAGREISRREMGVGGGGWGGV